MRLENPANPIHYQGMVCSLQPDERSGFIERADVVREIVFSSASVQGDRAITLGDEVEFTIQTVQVGSRGGLVGAGVFCCHGQLVSGARYMMHIIRYLRYDSIRYDIRCTVCIFLYLYFNRQQAHNPMIRVDGVIKYVM